jgi:hypothetical protein
MMQAWSNYLDKLLREAKAAGGEADKAGGG